MRTTRCDPRPAQRPSVGHARARFFAGLLLAGLTAVGTLAVAQPRGAKPPARPSKPAATGAKADAAAPGGAEEQGDKAGGSTAAASEGSAPEVASDGGVKSSPLNPTAQEMPGSGGVDAGAPVDYERLLADIAALRARVAAVSDNLYQSRVSVAVQTDGDHARIGRLTVSLDDGIVYTAPAPFSAPDMTTVYDHAVAPGRHAVTVDVDRKDDRDEGFRTSQRSRFTVEVPRDQRVDVQVKILDDSSMGGDFPSDKAGKYDLRFKVKAVAKPAGK